MKKQFDISIIFIILLLRLEIQFKNNSSVLTVKSKPSSLRFATVVSISGLKDTGFLQETGMKETWKDIKEHEGRYQISNFGRVKSLKRYNKGMQNLSDRILSQFINNKGYCKISIHFFGVKRCTHYFIHRLVAQAFIPNSKNKSQVNHKDFNKRNNYVSNLEWCTCLENVHYSIKHGRYKKVKV